MDCPTTTHYALRIGDREVTDVVYIPSRDMHYVYLKKLSFKRNVCHWLAFTDSYIGRAALDDTYFGPLKHLSVPSIDNQ